MNFSELGLSKRIAAALEQLGFVDPTEIQSRAIPVILAGRDLMASAETGSGKTAAYVLPIVQRLKGSSERLPRALVVVPTRELALQVHSQVERFSGGSGMRVVTIYGGTGYDKQVRLLRRGTDVVVATPGRLFDLIEQGSVDLSMVETLVLDEADRMLDMGFLPQVRKIIARLGRRRQTLMFSATIDPAVERIAGEFLVNPAVVRVNSGRVEPTAIDQRIFHVDETGKEALLIQLIKSEPDVKSVLVFARTRRRAAKIRKRLCAADVRAEEIHGDISQSQREKTLARYRDGLFSVLIATDIAARGLDIPAISHVFNYDLPDSPADYVHRIGRTGRAGRSGVALSFVSAEQRHLIRGIERVTGRALDPNAGQHKASAHRPSGGRPYSGRSRAGSAGRFPR